jgi:hypothetical protein
MPLLAPVTIATLSFIICYHHLFSFLYVVMCFCQ